MTLELVHALVEDRNEQGEPVVYWYTDTERCDECEYCRAGKCIQKVTQSRGCDCMVIVHTLLCHLN